MDENENLKNAISNFGAIAETTLVFYRAVVNAGATKEEAFETTQAYIAGLIRRLERGKNEKGN